MEGQYSVLPTFVCLEDVQIDLYILKSLLRYYWFTLVVLRVKMNKGE